MTDTARLIITKVLEAGIIGDTPGGPEMVAADIIEHLERAGYVISDIANAKPVAWMAKAGACTKDKWMAEVWRDQHGQEITPLYAAASRT